MALAFCLGSCGKAEVKPTGTVLVSMADNSYSPAIIRVPVGGSIVFINAGRNDHNAIAVDKSWSSEQTFGNIKMRPEDMSEIVLSKEGIYPFYCSFHATPDGKAGMVGVVIVGNVEYTPPGARGVLPAVDRASGVTRRVPQDYPTIQNGVDAANPGDLVLIDTGVYSEAVFVTTPSITLRGVDRNGVILDGKFELGTGIMIGGNGVAVENMTAKDYTLNGFFWTSVRGFRGSYLTAYNNGDYGIYAFGSTDGLFEHSYASGSPDSAFYVGQCAPCRVVLNDVIGEYSGLGYSGTNSSGDMYIINSRFSHNRSGISTSTFDIELSPPGRDTTIVGNVVNDSGLENEAAGFYATETLAGNGIALVGTHNNHVERNYVVRSRNNGIVVVPILDRHYWPSTGHVVRDNTVLDSGRADLAASGLGTIANCFSGNIFRHSLPWGLQALNGCGKFRIPLASDLSGDMTFFGSIAQIRAGRFTVSDYRTRPTPLAQPGIPGGSAAPVVPAVHVFADFKPNLDAIRTPVDAPRVPPAAL
jgi:plastocyanin